MQKEGGGWGGLPEACMQEKLYLKIDNSPEPCMSHVSRQTRSL